MEIPQFHPCSINYLVIRKINEVEYRVEYGWNYKKFHPCSFMCALCLYYWESVRSWRKMAFLDIKITFSFYLFLARKNSEKMIKT